jgi:hypothetical protein
VSGAFRPTSHGWRGEPALFLSSSRLGFLAKIDLESAFNSVQRKAITEALQA